MAYTVLARRYRSGTFDEVIGQEHVAQTLKKAIESDRIAHAFLFNGTRGVGKTSMARILAKALNCQAFDKPTPTPCGKCDSCVRVARGDDLDVIEIDAASNTGVDNVREVIENSQYRPARSRFKVYIIDEAHMLSKQAFNALLKTLEEPPSHVKFILATTEPEKILPTILSRCQRYDFRNIPTREIAAHLRDVCKKEQIEADDNALLLVAKAGAGSMRDALSLLDRLLSVGEKQLTVDLIEHMLGLPKSQLLFDLAGAIGDGDVKSALTQANAMVQAGLSVDGLIAALTDHLRNLLILRTCGPDSELVEVPGLAESELVTQAERFDPVALSQDIAVLEELRRHIRQSQAGRALLDATLVRMALSDQFTAIGDLLTRLEGGATSPAPARPPARPAPVRAPEPRAAPPPDALQKKKADELTPSAEVNAPPAPRAAAADSVAPPGEAVDDADDDLPAVGRVWEGPRPSLASLLSRHKSPERAAAVPPPAETAANFQAIDARNLPAVWQAMLQLLTANGPAGGGLHALLARAQLVAIEDGQAVVHLVGGTSFGLKQLERNGKKEAVRDAFTRVLGQGTGVRFELSEEAPAGPAVPLIAANPPAGDGVGRAPPRPSVAAAAPALSSPGVRVTPELVQSIREEAPLVRALMDDLGATIIKVE